jgi:AhpD family alkylhydroperoxidase
MAGSLVAKALRRSLRQVRHVTPPSVGAARDLVAKVYEQSERDFGMLAPPVALHSPAPGPLAGSWMMLRETLIAPGLVDRATKEAVAAAVSIANSCPYCVAVHGATAHGLLGSTTAAAIGGDDLASITDPVLRGIALWARTSGTQHTATAGEPPFPLEQAPELIGTAVAFQYLNRMVNVFLGESPLPPSVPASARPTVTKVLGAFMRAAANRPGVPGASLVLLPAAPLPRDLAWAAANTTVADAFSRAASAIDEAGDRAVPPAVRELIAARLARWDGRPAGISRGWVEDEVTALPGEERPAARLALLTALASYQVDQSVVDEFRLRRPGDETLVELTSWAALSAARRVGGWMWSGIHPGGLAPANP